MFPFIIISGLVSWIHSTLLKEIYKPRELFKCFVPLYFMLSACEYFLCKSLWRDSFFFCLYLEVELWFRGQCRLPCLKCFKTWQRLKFTISRSVLWRTRRKPDLEDFFGREFCFVIIRASSQLALASRRSLCTVALALPSRHRFTEAVLLNLQAILWWWAWMFSVSFQFFPINMFLAKLLEILTLTC